MSSGLFSPMAHGLSVPPREVGSERLICNRRTGGGVRRLRPPGPARPPLRSQAQSPAAEQVARGPSHLPGPRQGGGGGAGPRVPSPSAALPPPGLALPRRPAESQAASGACAGPRRSPAWAPRRSLGAPRPAPPRSPSSRQRRHLLPRPGGTMITAHSLPLPAARGTTGAPRPPRGLTGSGGGGSRGCAVGGGKGG